MLHRRLRGSILAACAAFALWTLLPAIAGADDAAPSDEPKTPSLEFKGLELAPDIKLYTDFQMDVSDAGVANAFHLTRGYLGMKFKMTDWFSARLTYDLTTVKGLPSAGTYDVVDDQVVIPDDNKFNASVAGRLKYAYVVLGIPPASMDICFGVAHTPWMDWIEHIEDTRFLRKVMWEQEFHYPSADFGVVWTGTVGDVIAYHGGVYNGEGYHGLENAGFKDVIGRITVRPIPHQKALAGLAFSVYAHGEFPIQDGEDTERRIGGAVTWRLADKIKSVDTAKASGDKLAVWYQIKHQAHGDPDDLANNLGMSFGVRVETPIRLFFIGRGDYFDEDLSAAGDSFWRAIGAVGVRVHPTFHFALNYQGMLPVSGDPEHLLGLHTEFHL